MDPQLAAYMNPIWAYKIMGFHPQIKLSQELTVNAHNIDKRLNMWLIF